MLRRGKPLQVWGGFRQKLPESEAATLSPATCGVHWLVSDFSRSKQGPILVTLPASGEVQELSPPCILGYVHPSTQALSQAGLALEGQWAQPTCVLLAASPGDEF